MEVVGPKVRGKHKKQTIAQETPKTESPKPKPEVKEEVK